MKDALKNPLTTIAGVVVLALVVLYSLGYVSQEQLMIALGVLAAYGFIVAKDGGK